MAKKSGTKAATNGNSKRSYVSQADVPAYSLLQALRICRAIADNYGKNPVKPLRVAEAMNMAPGSSHFRMLAGASIAYGLTDGGYNSEQIAITPLGRRVIAPTKEGDDVAAMKEALLRPRVIRDFLSRYNESKLPNATIGGNVLAELGVPENKTAEVFALIVEGASNLQLLREVKGSLYVDLDFAGAVIAGDEGVITGDLQGDASDTEVTGEVERTPLKVVDTATAEVRRRTGRVFITHGRNHDIVNQLKDLLSFGGFTPVVAIEQEAVSKPVPDKVLDDMRSCDAAIIHVGTDKKMIDADGKEHKMLNQNVLIEIGAAMALYGRKFILLVEKGAALPSNLQGLYEVRYEGEKLDYESTMKLLKAFSDFRG